ncbi:MAG TPA: allantoate amidohydrolase [Candidatus Dormibacteraeota bacterium]|nr:allantoate amidohydrolase [Candidatus Dormibacteraeota bacterium]
MSTAAQLVMERCDLLATCTEEPGKITRPFASDSMRRAQTHVERWMREAGLTVRRDNIGNLLASYPGSGSSTLLMGSHLDSVRDAGKYDGPLGVLVAIAAVQRLHDADRRLPFAVEVIAFADEEGLRFGSTYLGSRAVAGRLGDDELRRTDDEGVTMADAIRAFDGDPSRIADDRWSGDRPLGYVEVHIEQGPVLEKLGLPVGVVSAIAGQDRMRVAFLGEAGHAGTVPMEQRRDALVVAAMFVVAVEHEARQRPGLVATVGRLEVEPGAANVIPGRVELTLDVRHPDDAVRLEASQRLIADAHALAEGRGLMVDVRPTSERAAVACSPRLTNVLRQAIGDGAVEVASGAGHDGVYMSELTDIAMLFVRCKGGVSHNPAESVTVEDVGVAIDVVSRFLEML